MLQNLLTLFCLGAWAAGAAFAGQLALATAGKSSYTICVSRQASPSEMRAASELQRFLKEMSGARLPIVTDNAASTGPLILVGDSPALQRLKPAIDFPRLGAEGFALKTIGTHLVIAGGRQRGTMYGVYTFLEKLGCRWFARDASRIPRLPTIAIGPLNETQKPAFEYREVFVTEGFEKDWAARNKTNGNTAELDESTGGKVKYSGFVHTFNSLVPPRQYFKEHPEYFSLIDGARRVERSQLCLTNPDVLRIATAAVLERIRRNPDAMIFSVSQNDWYGFCECDNCRRVEQEEGGAHSGPMLRFVNALAAEVEKQHPDKLIDTLAYQYTEDPPLKVRPRRNVRVRLCPIGVCEAHPYEQCPRSAYFVRNLKAWSKITDQLYVWHYNTNFSHYLAPFPDFDELAANLPLYKRSGVVGLFLEGSYPPGGGGELAELRSYVMARLLWNPAIDVNREIDDFLAGYYGKAAPMMRAYLDLAHREVRPAPRGRGMHIWINPVPDYSDEFVAGAGRLFDKAEAAAEDWTLRQRVRKARLALDYVELLRAKEYTIRDGLYAPADLDALKKRFQSFIRQLRMFGVTSIHESRDLSVDETEFARIQPYKVSTLENDRLRVEVAPELSGRIVRILDKATGRDLLRKPEPGDRNYPATGGLLLTLYPDYHGREFDTRWEIDPASSDRELVLRGTTTGRKLALERRLALSGALLRTVTTVANGEAEPVAVALQSRVDWGAPEIDGGLVRFTTQSGAAIERELIRAQEPPVGDETFNAEGQPNGVWRFNKVGNRFQPEQVGRCFLNWTAKGRARVTQGIWSPQKVLAPRETLSLAADYGVID